MMGELDQLQFLVDELNENNSSSYKRNVLTRHPECKKILERVYSTFETFGVTSKTILKYSPRSNGRSSLYTTTYQLLDDLAARRLSGHEALEMVWAFIEANPEHENLILLILDRNLETRANAKLINKVWPGLIRTYDVALAEDIEEIPRGNLPNFEIDRWFASRKLDGLRNISEIIGDVTSFFSRRGKEFTSLGVLAGAIWANLSDTTPNLVLDGEICIVDDDGIEDFNAAVSEVKTKDHTVQNPRYYIFDILSIEDFRSKTSVISFWDRQRWLRSVVSENPFMRIVPQTLIKDQAHFDELFREAVEKGWEGLILRKDVSYLGKRSTDMLKRKACIDDEYEVIRVDFDEHRIIEDGQEVKRRMLANVWILHKGQEVSVGSGWKKPQRIYYSEHPAELVGATITVRYNGETKNKRGTISLRFPRVKAVHGQEGRVT